MENVTIPYVNSVFEQPWWLDLVAKGRWGEVFVKNGTEVIARLPYVMDNGYIRNPPYTQTLGIWMSESVRKFKRGNAQFNDQKEIVNELLNQLPKHKGLQLVMDHSQEYVLPFRWNGFHIEPRFSYRIKDLKDMEKVRTCMGKSIRREINLAKKCGLFFDDTSKNYEILIDLQNITYGRQGRKNPVNNEFTYNIVKAASELGRGKMVIARDSNGEAHCANFLLYDDKVCYHLMSGQNTKFGQDGVIPFMFDKEIEFASTKSQMYDFEGSMVESIEAVFKRYGGYLITNWQVTKYTLAQDIFSVIKPRIKKLIRYKI